MINDLWYKNAVIYCLSVDAYMDANGDGIGNFTGLMRRLDYLHGLGVTAIWLMPFQTSPCRDGGVYCLGNEGLCGIVVNVASGSKMTMLFPIATFQNSNQSRC
jgi:hypothetical protein